MPAEPFNDDGTFRVDVFSSVLNTSYIPIALRAARAADPHAKLYINDFNIEGLGELTPFLRSPVRSLVARSGRVFTVLHRR